MTYLKKISRAIGKLTLPPRQFLLRAFKPYRDAEKAVEAYKKELMRVGEWLGVMRRLPVNKLKGIEGQQVARWKESRRFLQALAHCYAGKKVSDLTNPQQKTELPRDIAAKQ